MNENNGEPRREGLERVEERRQLRLTVTQHAFVRDFSRQFAGETEQGWGRFGPAANGGLGRCFIESGIDLYGGEVPSIKFQPAGRREIGRIKVSTPFLEAPGAGPKPNFLLCQKIQTVRRIIGWRREGSLARE